jgi:spermidine/putrescine transport system permease protein
MKRGLAAYAAVAFAFLYLPLVVLVVFSFNQSKFTVWEGLSLNWYRAVLNNSDLAWATRNSVIIAIVSAILSTATGTMAAYGLWKRKSPVLAGSLYLSLVTPEIVTGISLLAFFQFIFRYLHFQLGLHTVILAHVAFSISYVAIVVSARLRAMDPALEEAALDLGAHEWTVFFRVTLPNLLPGVIAAGLLALIVSFDDYVITSLVAGVDSETLPMVIYAMARRGVNPEINAISAMIVVVFGVLIIVSEKVRAA